MPPLHLIRGAAATIWRLRLALIPRPRCDSRKVLLEQLALYTAEGGPHRVYRVICPSITWLRDFALPLEGAERMDINYILGWEQTSLYNASMAASSCARASHLGLASAYGLLLEGSTFPHRHPLQLRFGEPDGDIDSADRWSSDEGLVSSAGASATPGYVDQAAPTPQIHTAAERPSRARVINQPAPSQHGPHMSSSALVRSVEHNERLLALRYADGHVSAKSFQSQTRFARQDRAGLASRHEANAREDVS